MSRPMIGSSIICLFYKPEFLKEYKHFVMIKPTKFKTFKARMAHLEVEKMEVVMSVMENFSCNAVGSDQEDEDSLNEVMGRVINEFLTEVKNDAEKYPRTKFVVVKPIQ
jgi:hypothetical protein